MQLNEKMKTKFDEINDKLGGALSIMKANKKVIGREKDLEKFAIAIESIDGMAPLLTGDAGTGKTAIVETYVTMLEEYGEDVVTLDLDVGTMAEDTSILKVRMTNLMKYIREFETVVKDSNPYAKIILFVDEVHILVNIFDGDTQIGGDLLKKALGRAEEFCVFIGATTVNEYIDHIKTDEAFDRRFTRINIEEVDKETTKIIVKDWIDKHQNRNDALKYVSEEVLNAIIQYNDQYITKTSEPAKSLKTISYVESASRVLGRNIDVDLVKYAFESQYGIDLNFNIDLAYCEKVIKEEIIGQPIAIDAVLGVLQEIKLNSAKVEKEPRYVGNMVGPTGVGKTQMAKAISKGIFKSDNRLIKIDLTTYGTAESADRLRRDLGHYLENNADKVIVFDEMEKAHDTVLNVLLTILDEGITTYEMEGSNISYDVNFRNSIIFLTSNAGAETFKTLDKRSDVIFEGDVMTEEYQVAQREISMTVQEALENSSMRPEFLQRVKATIPFLGLSQETKIMIAEREINRTISEFEKLSNVKVELPQPVSPIRAGVDTKNLYNPLSLYIVIECMQKHNTNMNGARHIKRMVLRDVRGMLNRTLFKHEDCRSIKLLTNGLCRWEIGDSGEKQGLLKVEVNSSYNRMSIGV